MHGNGHIYRDRPQACFKYCMHCLVGGLNFVESTAMHFVLTGVLLEYLCCCCCCCYMPMNRNTRFVITSTRHGLILNNKCHEQPHTSQLHHWHMHCSGQHTQSSYARRTDPTSELCQKQQPPSRSWPCPLCWPGPGRAVRATIRPAMGLQPVWTAQQKMIKQVQVDVIQAFLMLR